MKAQSKSAKGAKKPAAKAAAKNDFSIKVTTAEFKACILRHLEQSIARDPQSATNQAWWTATVLSVRELILKRFIATQSVHHDNNTRRVYYLSLEYLMGRLLSDTLDNCGLLDTAKAAIAELGLDYDQIANQEADMGLGNGGLGRLASCFLDSMATLDYPSVGYGIHYEFGLFRQGFLNGRQVEYPDNWLRFGNPWKILRPEHRVEVQIGGRVETHFNDKGDLFSKWVGGHKILGVPWDIPIPGYQVRTVNFLRLWEAKATQEFDFQVFNRGGYIEAVHEKAVNETVSKILYPNDKTESGKSLRLIQQYFFVCCSLHDIIRRFCKKNSDWKDFSKKVAIQLNDTHPSVAVAELMRILLDDENLSWEKAWDICTQVFAYTNHTLLPEALEKWSVPLFEQILPRHLQIIYEINRRFLETVEARWPGDDQKKSTLSLIEEGRPKMIRMAYLAVIASHSVNGVAALHTELLKSFLFHDFDELYPGRFNNKTNGVTPRRWLKLCNPLLSELLDEKIGTGWVTDLDELKKIEPLAKDAAFQKRFMDIKRANKQRLAVLIKNRCGITVSPDAIFDCQIKRLHEYKRQHLNLLHIMALYRRLLHNPNLDIVPRVFVFGAKAAPGYDLAKDIIHAINAVGAKINSDERIQGKLKVAFIPNYGVTMAETIIPAADVSEQISTAGKEASGTGNMKFMMNGAVTIGTLDGANVEINEQVGKDNIFIFGLTVKEVEALQKNGYNPWDYYNSNEELKAVLDWLASDFFTPEEPHSLESVRRSLLEGGDPFLVCADFAAYCQAQDAIDKAFRDSKKWAQMAILNTARSGLFSSDRTIHQYAKDIWHLDPLPIP